MYRRYARWVDFKLLPIRIREMKETIFMPICRLLSFLEARSVTQMARQPVEGSSTTANPYDRPLLRS